MTDGIKTDADLILEILRRARGDWVKDLYAMSGVMVHSRIADLRQKGCRIECKRFGHKDYRYRLLEEPAKEEATL